MGKGIGPTFANAKIRAQLLGIGRFPGYSRVDVALSVACMFAACFTQSALALFSTMTVVGGVSVAPIGKAVSYQHEFCTLHYQQVYAAPAEGHMLYMF